MIDTLDKYLGLPAHALLSATPFKAWRVEKSFENDLPLPLINYVFSENGLIIVCDGAGSIATIFLFAEEYGGFDANGSKLSFALSRQQVLNLLGEPSKTSPGVMLPILGEYGPWDRFTRAAYSIHIEYAIGDDKIKKITLMRPDVTPV